MTTEQTQDGFAFTDVKVEISVDADFSDWTDISGFFSSIKQDGGKRKIGEVYTAAGDTPIITKGKRESVGVSIKTVYTEGATDPYAVVSAAHAAGTPVGIRYQPKQGVGSSIFTALGCIIEDCPLPQGDVENGDPLTFEWSAKGARFEKTAATA